MKEAKMLYGSTMIGANCFSADLLWRTNFKVVDPVFFAEANEQRYLFVPSLEFNRAAKEVQATEVINVDSYRNEHADLSSVFDVVGHLLKTRGITRIIIPGTFPAGAMKKFRKYFSVRIMEKMFYPERLRKTSKEIGHLQKAQQTTENAFQVVMRVLEESVILEGYVYHEGRQVTSEYLRNTIHQYLYSEECLPIIHTIVACGGQAGDPHNFGSGLISAHNPIIIDIFPVDIKTSYWGDMTRTFFKGEPSKEMQSMYNAVLAAQTGALGMVRSGVDGYDIWEWVIDYFTQSGYPTDFKRGTGFFHGVGHGVGVEIHEDLRISKIHTLLEEGNVVTVEPGLYYGESKENSMPVGGIRIEDMVVVEKEGCRNLNTFPKDLESMIL